MLKIYHFLTIFRFSNFINTIHNLELPELKVGLDEISRVSRKNSFITVDAYTNEEEKNACSSGTLPPKQYCQQMSGKNYLKIVIRGDYFWFIP